MRYPIVIHKDPNSDYGVAVPDLPGCFSAGETVEDALTQAVEAIECHIEGMLLDGESVPSPQDSAIHQNNPDFADGIWKSVPINFETLTGSVLKEDPPSFFQRIMCSFSASHLLPYAAGILVLIIGGIYVGNRLFTNNLPGVLGVPEGQLSKLTPVQSTKVERTLVRGQGKEVRVSPSGFGAFPKIPADFPDQNIWNVVEKRSIHDPDGAKTLELLARVRIKLWEQGKFTKGVIMDPSSKLIYPDSGIKILSVANTDDNPRQSQYDTYFDDGLIPQGRISVEFLEGGIDPYEFLNLPR